jgi:hypothetical protein
LALSTGGPTKAARDRKYIGSIVDEKASKPAEDNGDQEGYIHNIINYSRKKMPKFIGNGM